MVGVAYAYERLCFNVRGSVAMHIRPHHFTAVRLKITIITIQVLVVCVVEGSGIRWDCARASFSCHLSQEFPPKCHVSTGVALAYKADSVQCQTSMRQIFKKGASARPEDYAAVCSVNVGKLASLHAALMKQ